MLPVISSSEKKKLPLALCKIHSLSLLDERNAHEDDPQILLL